MNMRNQYEIRNETTAFFLNRKDGTTFETLIDTHNLSRVLALKSLFLSRDGYCHASTYDAVVQLHRYLLNPPRRFVVDHINHNPLDNRLSNLRAVSIAFNSLHRRGATRLSRTGIRGVWWHKGMRQWQARIEFEGKKIEVGFFDTAEEAQSAVETSRSNLVARLLKDPNHVLQ